MRLLRYLLAVWTAVVVYTLFSLLLGQNGLFARMYLEAEQSRLLKNHEVLQLTNKELMNTKNNLMYDHDTISVYARQLGYGMEGEKYVRIMGLGIAVNTEVPVGQVFYAASPDFVPDYTIKIISVFFGLAVFLFFILRDLSMQK
jgi:cell division protein FtsB